MRKFNFLDDEKVKWEEGKIEAGHRTSLLHNIFFCASLFKCFFWSTQLSRFEMHNVFYFIFSHGKIIWKAFNAAFEDFSLSWSFCPAKCWYREWNKKKKIRLWSTLFSSATSKMIHVIEKKILPPFEERSMEKENFWLNDDLHGLPLLLKQHLVYENMKLLFSTQISAPKIPTRFSVQEQSSLNTRIVDSGIGHFNYIINDVNFTSEKKNGSRTSPLSRRLWTWSTTR